MHNVRVGDIPKN